MFLHETFPIRVTPRFSVQIWPPPSYDLTPMNFFCEFPEVSSLLQQAQEHPHIHAHIERCINEMQP